jgi:hypothetical protein
VDHVPDPLLLRKSGSAGIPSRTSGSVARNSDHYSTEAVSEKKNCSARHVCILSNFIMRLVILLCFLCGCVSSPISFSSICGPRRIALERTHRLLLFHIMWTTCRRKEGRLTIEEQLEACWIMGK